MTSSHDWDDYEEPRLELGQRVTWGGSGAVGTVIGLFDAPTAVVDVNGQRQTFAQALLRPYREPEIPDGEDPRIARLRAYIDNVIRATPTSSLPFLYPEDVLAILNGPRS